MWLFMIKYRPIKRDWLSRGKYTMNMKSKIIIDELIKSGLIVEEEDLTAKDKTNFIFDYMIRKYSYLLNDDIDIILPKSNFDKGKIIHEIIVRYGKFFLKNPQIIEDKESLLDGDEEIFIGENKKYLIEKTQLPDEPVIFLTNHGFKDDILATMIAAERRAFILFGSLPQFYGTLDGLLSAKNGVVMVNRKVKKSRATSVDKGKYVLNNGMSLMVCPEGVWNKSPNMAMLEFWSGFYRMAKKEDGTFYPIVPIVHYIGDTHKPGKDNPIYTIIDNPIRLDGMNEKEAVEYIRTRMLTWYWKLMEIHGKTTREKLLDGYENSVEAWEDELKERVKTATKYDYSIEISADRISKEKREKDQLSVWLPIADLYSDERMEQLETIEDLDVFNREVGALYEGYKAKKLVKELEKNDFQHRF